MGEDLVLFFLDIFGVLVFAISGSLGAVEKKMDIWGMFLLAIVTSMGGGTLRSILIGDLPPVLLTDARYLLIAAIGTLISFFFCKWIKKLNWPIVVFDAIGLGLFTCVGISISIEHQFAYWSALCMGIVTACFGGIMRDVLRGEIPFILQKELYATACLMGGLLYLTLSHYRILPHLINITFSIFVILVIRILAVKMNLGLPKPKV